MMDDHVRLLVRSGIKHGDVHLVLIRSVIVKYHTSLIAVGFPTVGMILAHGRIHHRRFVRETGKKVDPLCVPHHMRPNTEFLNDGRIVITPNPGGKVPVVCIPVDDHRARRRNNIDRGVE